MEQRTFLDIIPLISDTVSMVDFFALRVGETQLLAQGGSSARQWPSMPGHTTTTFGVVCATSST